ncbi:hypothetical protein [Peribacillus alkalitolerans]|uniref:hypothetical protein n=1 Tax=Peribacillus alkalitolerans TaxID=1550385 RepID=UPI0013D2325C|nr:hypothetical protein [Peribacillus alkalitolerans]
MQSLEKNGYTKKEIMDVLHSRRGPRKLRFRYDLLDKQNRFIKTLNSVLSGEVSMDSLADIKRKARFTIKDDGSINFFSDRIQPFVEIEIPTLRRHSEMIPKSWIAFPLGIFLLSSPTRKDQTNGVFRDVDAYGGLVILRDDKFDSTYVIPSGTKVYDAIIALLLSAGIASYNIEFTNAVLQRDIEFEPGKEKLYAVNELLRQINYTPIYDDVNGIFTSAPYRSPAVKAIDYTYRDDDASVTFQGMEEVLDLFEVPNKWVVVCSNPEQTPIGSTYINENMDSPSSTINRGRTIVDYREVSDIADQTTLDAYVQRIAFEASQVYGKITFETALMPMHDYGDILEIDYSPLNIMGKYSETSWTMPLAIGGKMRHEVRKVVTI